MAATSDEELMERIGRYLLAERDAQQAAREGKAKAEDIEVYLNARGEADSRISGAERAALLTEILETLPPDHPFVSTAQIADFFYEQAFRMDETFTVTQLLESLRKPRTVFTYTCAISAPSPLSIDVELEPETSLRIEPAEEHSGYVSHRLSGRIAAGTVQLAGREVEAVCEEILGGLVALGLARLIAPTPSGSPAVEIEIEPRPPSFSNPVARAELSRAIGRLRFETSLPEDERHERLKALRRLVRSRSDHAVRARNAARFYIRGLASVEFGQAVFELFAALEGMLLEPKSKSDIQARLAEALAFSLADTSERRSELRRIVKKRYADRSDYVHKGNVRETRGARDEWAALVTRIMEREILGIPD